MSAHETCRHSRECRADGHFCDTVIHYCEPCGKHICNKRSHPLSRECCTLCPDKAETYGYDCSAYKPHTKKTPVPTAGVITKMMKSSTRKSLELSATENPINDPMHIGKRERVRSDFNPQQIGANPWLFTTLILATTFVILVVVVVCLIIFLRYRSKYSKGGSSRSTEPHHEEAEMEKLNNEKNSTSASMPNVIIASNVNEIDSNRCCSGDSAYSSKSNSRQSSGGSADINTNNGRPMDESGERKPLNK